jgi:hypothetical protein
LCGKEKFGLVKINKEKNMTAYAKLHGRKRYYDQMEAEEAWSETIYKIREAIKKAEGE